MSILTWLGKKIGLTNAAFWRQYFGTETWAGEDVSVEAAMQLGAFFGCVRLIAGCIGGSPINLHERLDDGGSKILRDNNLHRIVHYLPNGEQDALTMWEGMGASLCVHGNAFAEKMLSASGDLFALKLMATETTVVERTLNTGRLQYRYRDPMRNMEERILQPESVLHVRGFGFGGDLGLSPVAFARQSLGSARAVERTAASTFANGLRPSGWLVYKGGTLDQPQRDQAKKQLIEPMQGSGNAGKTGILEADFDYKPMSIPPEDAQMLQSRAFSVEDVCRWLGVPPILVGHASAGQTMWGSGIEQILIGFITLGLTPYLRRFERALDRSLLKPEEVGRLGFKFDVDALLAADSAARSTLHSTYVQNGIMLRNEVRAKLNLPKIEGGDIATVQVNLTPLAKMQRDLDNPPAPVAVPAPPAAGTQPGEDPNAQPAKPKLVVNNP